MSNDLYKVTCLISFKTDQILGFLIEKSIISIIYTTLCPMRSCVYVTAEILRTFVVSQLSGALAHSDVKLEHLWSQGKTKNYHRTFPIHSQFSKSILQSFIKGQNLNYFTLKVCPNKVISGKIIMTTMMTIMSEGDESKNVIYFEEYRYTPDIQTRRQVKIQQALYLFICKKITAFPYHLFP